MNRAQLRAIIVPRLVEIFRLAKGHVAQHVTRDVLLAEVVITGGGAHLGGIEAAASEFFGLPVRIGVPNSVGGLTDAVKQPQYSTAVGLVVFGPKGDAVSPNGRRHDLFARFGNWLTEMWN